MSGFSEKIIAKRMCNGLKRIKINPEYPFERLSILNKKKKKLLDITRISFDPGKKILVMKTYLEITAARYKRHGWKKNRTVNLNFEIERKLKPATTRR